jgi:hypothetical protein
VPSQPTSEVYLHPWQLDSHVIHAHVNTLEVNQIVDVLFLCFFCNGQLIEEFELPVLILNELLEGVYLVDSLLTE